MKINLLPIACCVLVFSICISCSHFDHHGGNTHVSISESEDEYRMSAYFNENKMNKIYQYMDERLGDRNNFSFANSKIDATLTLDDRTTFYLKTSPGDLEIKFDKDRNSVESYNRVKKMCEGIKNIIGKD